MAVKKKTENVVEKIENSVVDTVKKAGEKVEEVAEEAVDKVEELVEGKESEKKTAKKTVSKKDEETKEESKAKKTDEQTLVPLEDYVKAGIYIGTKVVTPHMRKYVYRRRNDGIAILNTNMIDEELKKGIEMIKNYEPDDWVIVCKREAGWRAVKLFSQITGVRVFTKKYPAGILTNTSLPNFFETSMVLICDPWLDKNALKDANKVKTKVIGFCDTNNLTSGIDFVMPANNKSNKSLGLAFYILAKEYMKAKGIKEKIPSLEDFIGEKLEELPLKKEKEDKVALEKDEEKIKKILESAGESAEHGVWSEGGDILKAIAAEYSKINNIESMADREFVVFLYDDLLERVGSSSEIDFWVNKIENEGATWEAVAKAFIQTLEFESVFNAALKCDSDEECES